MQSILVSDEKDGTNAGRNDLHISLQRLRQLPVVWRRAVQGPQAARSDEGEGSAAQPDQLQGDGQGVWGVRRPEDGVSRHGRAVRELPARRGELQLPADGLHQRQKRWIQTRNTGHCCCCCYLLSLATCGSSMLSWAHTSLSGLCVAGFSHAVKVFVVVVYFFYFFIISIYGSSMLSWAHTSVVWAVCCQIQTCS